MNAPLLEITDLSVAYQTDTGPVMALRGANLMAQAGEVIGIVGESGGGKSTLAAAVMNLLPTTAKVTGGAVRFLGEDILTLAPQAQRALRGTSMAMIFQDPMTAFNPVLTMGDHLADEPTTALDVTTEAQILHLLRNLRQTYQGTIVVISHHLGVVAELCDRVYVMYAGQVVEQALVDDLFHAPRHPYTRALLACDPASFTNPTPVLPTIPGRLPDLRDPPKGCSFAPRCPLGSARCAEVPPWAQVSPSHGVLCHEVTL